MAKTKWKSYEEVAQYLLNQFADNFQLGRVEGKQIVPGESGTDWELDAKGVKANGKGFLIVECRRYTSSRLKQKVVGGLAFQIEDTGADGGIIVSPLGLQKGAKKVAEHKSIKQVILAPESTNSNYLLSFLNQTFMGFVETVSASSFLELEVVRNEKVVD